MQLARALALSTTLLGATALAACGPGPRDPGGGGGDVDGGVAPDGGDVAGVTYVYAHTASTLYRVDPDTLAVTEIGPFRWPGGGSDQMTDIAIDKAGQMIGVSFSAVYRVDPGTAQTTRLSGALSGTFNGLSFVPAAMVGASGDDVLVGTRNDDGVVFRIDPATGQATPIGDMGSYASSGDLVAVTGFTVLTADNGLSADRLVRLTPNTFSASPIGNTTGFSEIWGVAYWRNKIFGFTSSGQFVTIDPTTGVGTLVQGNGPAWWGAAVTTSAPVIF